MSEELKELPDPPGSLSDAGKYFYDTVGAYLVENDLLQKVDTMLLYTGAGWWHIFIEAQKAINDGAELVIYHDTGHQSPSPHIANMQKADSALRQIFPKLGVGEAARLKLNVMGGHDGHDPMEHLDE